MALGNLELNYVAETPGATPSIGLPRSGTKSIVAGLLSVAHAPLGLVWASVVRCRGALLVVPVTVKLEFRRWARLERRNCGGCGSHAVGDDFTLVGRPLASTCPRAGRGCRTCVWRVVLV